MDGAFSNDKHRGVHNGHGAAKLCASFAASLASLGGKQITCRQCRVVLQNVYAASLASLRERGAASAAEFGETALARLNARINEAGGRQISDQHAVRQLLFHPLLRPPRAPVDECRAFRACLLDATLVLCIAYMRAGGSRWRRVHELVESFPSSSSSSAGIVRGGRASASLTYMRAVYELGCGRPGLARVAVHQADGGNPSAGGQRAQGALLFLAAHLYADDVPGGGGGNPARLASPTSAPRLHAKPLLLKCATLGACRRRTADALNLLGFVEARAGRRESAASFFLAAAGGLGGDGDGDGVAGDPCQEQLLAARNYCGVLAAAHGGGGGELGNKLGKVARQLLGALESARQREHPPNSNSNWRFGLPPCGADSNNSLLAPTPIAHALALTCLDQGDCETAATSLSSVVLERAATPPESVASDAAYMLLECERYDDALAVCVKGDGDGVARLLYRSDALLCLGRVREARKSIDKLLSEQGGGLDRYVRAQALNNRGLLRVCSGVKGCEIEAMRDFQSAIRLLPRGKRLQPAFNLCLLLWGHSSCEMPKVPRKKRRVYQQPPAIHFRIEACKWWLSERGWSSDKPLDYYTKKLLAQVGQPCAKAAEEQYRLLDRLVLSFWRGMLGNEAVTASVAAAK